MGRQSIVNGGGGHKLYVEIEILTPSASTYVSRLRDVNPKLNMLNEGKYTNFAVEVLKY